MDIRESDRSNYLAGELELNSFITSTVIVSFISFRLLLVWILLCNTIIWNLLDSS